MSLRTISSGPITFSSPSDKLSLDVDYQVALRLPSRKLETLSIGECLKALTSGEIWVAHGNSCRMDFSITLNGRELIETNNNHMIELLGKFVADAKTWTQLGLSTILHLQNSPLQKGSLSLQLNHNEPSTSPAIGARPWSDTTTDIRIPEAVLCAQMEQLKVCVAFRSGVMMHQSLKRMKILPRNLLTDADSMRPITRRNTATTSIVKLDPRERLSGILKECSESLYSSLTLHAIPALTQLSSFVSSGPFSIISSPSVPTISSSKGRKKKVKSLQKPSKSGTISSNKQGGNSSLLQDAAVDEMLLLSGDERNSTKPSDDNSASSLAIESLTRKRHSSVFNHEDNGYVLDPTASCKLMSAVIRVILAGTETRQRTTKGVKIVNIANVPVTSLATLSPVMFSPGFKKSVADNARYTPRIVQMMTSLARNAQTPSLRQKLAQIASMTTSKFANDRTNEAHGEITGELGSEKRLAAVVQARIWSMMQRTLHDPLAARKATNKRLTSENAIITEEDDGYDHLLNTIGAEDELENLERGDDEFRWIIDEHHSEKSAFDCILDDRDGASGDEFDDLFDDEDELLLSDEERERLEIECEMEEMFFGRRWQVEDEEPYEDDLLMEDSNHDELLLEEGDGISGERLLSINHDMLLI